jgi:hypothetical protein
MKSICLAVVATVLGLLNPQILRAQEQLLLYTTAGKVLIDLNPAVPKHLEQLQRLADAGVYSGSSVVGARRSGQVSFDPMQGRSPSLSLDQRFLIHSLPPESPRVPQLGDVVAYGADTPGYRLSGAGLVFFVFDEQATAGAQPSPRGTIMGHVVRGIGVVDELTRVPLLKNGEYDPESRIIGVRFVSPSVASMVSTEVQPVNSPPEQGGDETSERWTRAAGLLAGTLAFLSLGLSAVVLFDARMKSNVRNTLLLALLLIGYFILFAELAPIARDSQVLSIGLLAGLLSVIKLMNKFDTSPKPEGGPPAGALAAPGNKR